MAQPAHGLTQLLRSALRTRSELARDDGGRSIDLGVELRVVRQDLERGDAYLAGKPPLAGVAVHRVGGIWDVIERRFVGESASPVVWYVGERQAQLLLAIWERPLDGTRTMLISAEGGGKTVLMSQGLWVFILALSRLGLFGAIGATAPTHARLDTFVRTVCEQVPVDSAHEDKPDAFGTFYTASKDLRTPTGHTVQFRATKRASAATGSPVQGFTWLGSFDDELQDSVENGADPDIEARLRGARDSRRICTATAKDSPSWRLFRDSKGSGVDWRIERIRFNENPFVWPEHWARMQRNVSLREWQRRGLAMDVGPERMVYTAWDREQNLRPVPHIGAEDVTGQVLAPWGPRFAVLVGHDPGKLCDVSLVLQAFRLRGQTRPVWWVRDELTTEQTTTEQHVKALLDRLRSRWSTNRLDMRGAPAADGPLALVRADPYSNSGNDASRPDRSVYTLFRRGGIPNIMPAALRPSVNETKAATVPKNAGIDMVNGLLCNSNGERRLFVECDEHRQPMAPRLVEALEMSERNGDGEAEATRKDGSDLSHWCAALRYALWTIERPRVGEAAA